MSGPHLPIWGTLSPNIGLRAGIGGLIADNWGEVPPNWGNLPPISGPLPLFCGRMWESENRSEFSSSRALDKITVCLKPQV
jgi:hypothetical protein